jgi:hypothetical protein
VSIPFLVELDVPLESEEKFVAALIEMEGIAIVGKSPHGAGADCRRYLLSVPNALKLVALAKLYCGPDATDNELQDFLDLNVVSYS